MIRVCIEEPLSIIKMYPEQSIYCFGAGKCFSRFVSSANNIAISGVIDNYLAEKDDYITIDGISYELFSFDDYVSNASDKDTIVITSMYYKEFVEQMDDDPRLEGRCCYITSEVPRNKLKDYIDNRREKGVSTSEVPRGDGCHYQLWEYIGDTKDAGSKAPKDIRDILCKMGFSTINVHMDRCERKDEDSSEKTWQSKRSKEEWRSFVEAINADSVLVLQHPFRAENYFREQALLEIKNKNVKIISIVHDVEMIRGLNCTEYFVKETEFMMQIADAVVVQNDRMKSFFEKKWPEYQKLVSLQVFDYLSDASSMKTSQLRPVVKYAGSLEYRKSPFLYRLDELTGVKIQLYGPDFEMEKYTESKCPDNVEYCGAYTAEELPNRLDSGFGLIWDGEQLETCREGTGKYLTFNSPHKLSLYLASGLPVIVWEGAAIAEYVKYNGVGFTVNSLFEIKERVADITKKQYEQYAKAAYEIGIRLKDGYYTRMAMTKALEMIT